MKAGRSADLHESLRSWCFLFGFREGWKKAPKTCRSSAIEQETTRGLAQRLAVVGAVRCRSIHTRPVSWLGPKSFGTHTRTKGARCSAGGHRHGIPSAQVASSRLARRQGVRKPLMTEARHTDQGNGGGRDSWSNDLLAPSPDAGQTGRAHRCRRRRALWSPARCGTFASPPVKWPARQGKSEDQDALEAARRLRGALRRPVGDSIGSVPLQSG